MSPLTLYAFLKRHRSQGFCDDCLSTLTGLDTAQIEIIASTLSLFPAEFTRSEMTCPQGCGSGEKPVTAAI